MFKVYDYHDTHFNSDLSLDSAKVQANKLCAIHGGRFYVRDPRGKIVYEAMKAPIRHLEEGPPPVATQKMYDLVCQQRDTYKEWGEHKERMCDHYAKWLSIWRCAAWALSLAMTAQVIFKVWS